MAKEWSLEEDEILKRYYPVEGKDVYTRLLGRSKSACQHRARILRINSKKRWTKDEDSTLMEFYPSEGGNVSLRLPYKDLDSIYKRAHALKLKAPNRLERWSHKELEYLRKHYSQKGAIGVAEHLRTRSVEACRHKASMLGLAVNNRDELWSESEIDLLRKFYPSEGSSVYSRLSGRTREACIGKANSLGIKYMSSESSNFDMKMKLNKYLQNNILITKKEIDNYEILVSIGIHEIKIFLGENIEGYLFFSDNGTTINRICATEKEIHRITNGFGISYIENKLQLRFDIYKVEEEIMNMIICSYTLLNLYGNYK